MGVVEVPVSANSVSFTVSVSSLKCVKMNWKQLDQMIHKAGMMTCILWGCLLIKCSYSPSLQVQGEKVYKKWLVSSTEGLKYPTEG